MNSQQTDNGPMAGQLEFGDLVTRLRIAALWVGMMFVFAYVDIFGLFRADIIESVLAGRIFTFEVDQMFLLVTTIYIIIPSVMIYLTLALAQPVNRWLNLILPVVFALSIVAGMIGETWLYYLAGSAVEVILLIILAATAWRWKSV